jgi:sRNA-binding carbon storage regulator CsrA
MDTENNEYKSGLMLTRKVGQKVMLMIGEEKIWITLELIRKNNKAVSLRFNASDKVAIFRGELLDNGTDEYFVYEK